MGRSRSYNEDAFLGRDARLPPQKLVRAFSVRDLEADATGLKMGSKSTDTSAQTWRLSAAARAYIRCSQKRRAKNSRHGAEESGFAVCVAAPNPADLAAEQPAVVSARTSSASARAASCPKHCLYAHLRGSRVLQVADRKRPDSLRRKACIAPLRTASSLYERERPMRPLFLSDFLICTLKNQPSRLSVRTSSLPVGAGEMKASYPPKSLTSRREASAKLGGF